MATTTPLHGPMPASLSHAVTCAVAIAAHDSLSALHKLDAATSADSRPTVGRAYFDLLSTLFVHSDAPMPSTPPDVTQVAAAVAGASEAERGTALRILVEVARFLTTSASALAIRIRAIPSAWQPEDWVPVLEGVTNAAYFLAARAEQQDLSTSSVTDILTRLLQGGAQ